MWSDGFWLTVDVGVEPRRCRMGLRSDLWEKHFYVHGSLRQPQTQTRRAGVHILLTIKPLYYVFKKLMRQFKKMKALLFIMYTKWLHDLCVICVDRESLCLLVWNYSLLIFYLTEYSKNTCNMKNEKVKNEGKIKVKYSITFILSIL